MINKIGNGLIKRTARPSSNFKVQSADSAAGSNVRQTLPWVKLLNLESLTGLFISILIQRYN